MFSKLLFFVITCTDTYPFIYLFDIIPPIYVPVENPSAYENTINILLLFVFSASFTTRNQTVISINPIILAIMFLFFTVIIVLIVPNDTSNILTKNIFIHRKSILSPFLFCEYAFILYYKKIIIKLPTIIQ